MADSIDIHDLSEEEAELVREFVDMLRKKQATRRAEDEQARADEWSRLAATSLAEDWDNDEDARYDDWREHYRVPER